VIQERNAGDKRCHHRPVVVEPLNQSAVIPFCISMENQPLLRGYDLGDARELCMADFVTKTA
jgi:hypothetical protein